MANESKTELLVYDHFKQFKDKINIEPKKSISPSIDKLLQNNEIKSIMATIGTDIGKNFNLKKFYNGNFKTQKI